MKGKDVLRKAGWDTHGLPVELEVEKLLGLDGKPQIEAYGIEPFIAEVQERAYGSIKHEWEEMSDRVGFWADMENPYITYEDDYIESEWWSLKEIWKKGLLYKGFKVVPYCPRCGTALSSHEVAQGYKEVSERSGHGSLQGRRPWRIPISSPGPPRPGRCPATWPCASTRNEDLLRVPDWMGRPTSWRRRWLHAVLWRERRMRARCSKP